ncbi:uncharacterized protein EURHEDRAFT_377718 [Aspergillus ruber CBS 135680]|uniref:Linalool dehydratase/isomerase domain-containing protein n=1 Tax=Aspergillus ruber (strain CBS 135680) TaxID=1388766 RepID=A0A017SDV0_ASPRC|nr:uncharacterized protein EURHEDRAFT_377718 [Aspergillus ruber CBS 135680]EYE95183.1 hypothetical protein EURHEDRAFT_377718 [Aspergillus ruber CBS 135680]
MLRREVWGYWYLTPPSGIRVDPDLSELRKPWADPVARENNMYSGHLLLMTSLYAMPFGGDVFEQAGSLSFHWNPLFWGMGDETFAYDNRSLQDAIIVEWKGMTGLVFRAAAFMNTWNSEFVRSGINNHAFGFVIDIAGEVKL